MLIQTMCVLLAPVAAYAAAFPWALPEATKIAPTPDNWSPAPTAAPQLQLPGLELFRRQNAQGGNTCGFVSGSSQLPFTCSNSNFVCATNTLHGVHGCCDPANLSSCTIPTTCIASTALSTLCTDATCSNDPYVLRCSQADLPNCYKWIVSYSKTSMTQHGCAAAGFTSTALRSYASSVADVKELTTTVAVTVQVTPTPSSTPTFLAQPGSSAPNLGAIVGGTIGGCTLISLLILSLIIFRRRRRRHTLSTTQVGTGYIGPTSEIDSHTYGYPAVTYSPNPNDAKNWLPHTAGPVTRVSDAVPEYPHMGAGRYGVVEVDGVQRPVEVEAGWNHR